MKTMTINKGNWSGETGTIRVSKNRLYLYDYRFTLKRKHYNMEEFTCDKIEVYGDGFGPFPLLTATRYSNEPWFAHTEGIERYDNSEYVAIAQVLFNII